MDRGHLPALMESCLLLKQDHLEQMIRHVDAHTPLEACGLLAGRDGQVEAILPIANAEQSPARFRMDPLEQLHAFEWIDTRGLNLVGIYHSHPAGPETVSPTDIAEATYEVAQIILSPRSKTWIARGFHIQAGQAMEIRLQVE